MRKIMFHTLLVLTLLMAASWVTAQEEVSESTEAVRAETSMEGDASGELEMETESEMLPLLMSPDWAAEACTAWNTTEELTTGLVKWIQNDKDRGFKVIQLYRLDCEESPWIELRLVEEEGEARCVYGGAVETTELESGADYIMNAKTDRWQQMGAGDYGPMKGMMTGRLKFKGPKFEAMRNMGPFSSFLLLVGDVLSDVSACPA